MRMLICVCCFVLCAVAPAYAAGEPDVLKGSLSVGDKAGDFTLPNANGNKVRLYEVLKIGPVVLSFYRGGWCPICSNQLRGLQKILPEIEGLGAQLIAVSPEPPTYVEATRVKDLLTFEVLSDKGNGLAKQYGILWTVPEQHREELDAWLKESTGKTLADYNDQKGYELPVPATFVINKDGTVIYAFKEVNYALRANPEDILQALRSIH